MTRECTWSGSHSGDPVVNVTISTGCACKNSETKTDTCKTHLEELHSHGGKAPVTTICNLCGVASNSRIVHVEDLD